MNMTPETEAELVELIQSAQTPMNIQGGGTRLIGASGHVVSLGALSGVSLYEPGALTMVAQSGTPVSEIEAVLKTQNQRLAFEPPDLRDVLGTQGESTIGGIVASNASGPRRIAAGACRDFALGVRFVDGQGQVIKNGGRVMKNVTGYDLVKLMAGSFGTLGVLSEVSLKVLPDVEMSASLRLDGLRVARSVEAMSAALGSPFEVSGAARDADGVTWLRLEGFEASVRYRGAHLRDKLREFGTCDLVEDTGQVWADLRDARAFAGTSGNLWRLSVKPSDAPEVLNALRPSRAVLDWGGGLLWVDVPAGRDVRQVVRVAGHATLMRASTEQFQTLGRFHPEPSIVSQLSENLRAKFDPKGLLNPQLMGAVS